MSAVNQATTAIVSDVSQQKQRRGKGQVVYMHNERAHETHTPHSHT